MCNRKIRYYRKIEKRGVESEGEEHVQHEPEVCMGPGPGAQGVTGEWRKNLLESRGRPSPVGPVDHGGDMGFYLKHAGKPSGTERREVT